MAKIVNIDMLGVFKGKQDRFNDSKFMKTNDFVDAEGKIKSEKISVESGIEIIKMHVDSSDAENIKYFADDNGEKSTAEITGEVGKIYIDLTSGGKTIYTFSGENFVPFSSDIATTEDIESLFSE